MLLRADFSQQMVIEMIKQQMKPKQGRASSNRRRNNNETACEAAQNADAGIKLRVGSGSNVISGCRADGDDYAGGIDFCLRQHDSVHFVAAGPGCRSRARAFGQAGRTRRKNADETKERQGVIFAQLDKLTSRARILQRSMVTFYLATGMFVATSVAIGVVAVIPSSPRYNYVPVVVGLLGACCLFYGSILLIFEARLALSTIHAEMDFIWRQGTRARRRIWSNSTNHILCIFAVTSRNRGRMSEVSGQIRKAKPAYLTATRDGRAGAACGALEALARTLHRLPARLFQQPSAKRNRGLLFRTAANRLFVHSSLWRRAGAGRHKRRRQYFLWQLQSALRLLSELPNLTNTQRTAQERRSRMNVWRR